MAQVFESNDNDKTLQVLETAYKKVGQIDAAVVKANSNLDKYVQTYRQLNKELKEFNSLGNKAKGIKIGGSGASGGIGSIASGSKSGQGTAKSAGNMSGAFNKNFASTASKMVKGTALKSLAPMLAATSGIAALGLAVKGLADVTMEAERRAIDYTKALKTMGVQLDTGSKMALSYANTTNKLSNQLTNLGDAIGTALGPVLTILGSVASFALSALGVSSEEPKSKVAGAQAASVTRARMQGFNAPSSRNMAGSIYTTALGMSTKWGEQASDISNALSEAVFTGKGAEKYGINLSDNVLTGYMAQKGVDIANVEITEAMKSYYRFQLMNEEAAADNSDAMAEQIKGWEQLGFTIDKTKNKLFGFDEVIQLTAMDSRIPDVAGNGLYEGEEGKGGPVIPPITPQPGPGGQTDKPQEISDPVNAKIYNLLNLRLPNFNLLFGQQGQAGEAGQAGQAAEQGQIGENDVVAQYFKQKYGIDIDGLSADIASQPYAPNLGIEWVQNSQNDKYVYNKANPSQTLAVDSPEYRAWWQAKTGMQWGQHIGWSGGQVKDDSLDYLMYPKGQVGEWQSTLSEGQQTALKVMEGIGLGTAGVGLLGILGLLTGGAGASAALGAGSTMTGTAAASAGAGTALVPYSAAAAMGLPEAFVPAAATAATTAAGAGGAGGAGLINLIRILAMMGGGAAASGFADGGIGTKEIHNASLFEGNKKEAVIPLESAEGINYLSEAMKEAGAGSNGIGGDSITVNLTLSGLNIANNQSDWQWVAQRIAEEIDVQRQRRGELNYGASY